jgi:phosphatidylethanolamine/phosphatidyl-N-methylethanolamine N-methyltransferase
LGSGIVLLDTSAVLDAYRRWAPVYDWTFGRVAAVSRRHVVRLINRRRGRVLEVGVGTGLTLPDYGDHLAVTGIDLSPDMLAKARARIARKGLQHVGGLFEMDASALSFPDDSFETVVAMYVMTVVPDPQKVMAELERVCVPGGEVILVNHFSQERGLRGWFEQRMAPLAELLGWHPVFPVDTVMVREDLRLAERTSLWPCGLFTVLRFIKEPGFGRGAIRLAAAAPEPARMPAPAFGLKATSAGLLSPSKLRPHLARSMVHARRLLDIRYWRSLFRRLASQLAE